MDFIGPRDLSPGHLPGAGAARYDVPMRNTGKASEAVFQSSLERAGAFVHRFEDAAHLVGLNGGRALRAPPQPADFLVTSGLTFFAEIKSTSSRTGFRFSMLEAPQRAAAIKQVRAGGRYFVFVHRLPEDEWYQVPYQTIAAHDSVGKKSMSWAELDPYRVVFQ